MHNVTKTELLGEIDTCLRRNDLTHIEFVVLQSLKYLIENTDEKEK